MLATFSLQKVSGIPDLAPRPGANWLTSLDVAGHYNKCSFATRRGVSPAGSRQVLRKIFRDLYDQRPVPSRGRDRTG